MNSLSNTVGSMKYILWYLLIVLFLASCQWNGAVSCTSLEKNEAGVQPDSIVVTLIPGGESDQVFYYWLVNQDGRVTERCDASHEFEFRNGVVKSYVKVLPEDETKKWVRVVNQIFVKKTVKPIIHEGSSMISDMPTLRVAIYIAGRYTMLDFYLGYHGTVYSQPMKKLVKLVSGEPD